MRTDHVTGFLLILIAAVMNGAYEIPMKFMSRWKWENIWLVWTILSLWALPLALDWAAVPHPIQAYSTTRSTSLAVMGVMGVLWGAGVLLLGMSVSGAKIVASVEAQRPSTPLASIAVWMPVLLAGGIPGTLYSLSLLIKNRSTSLYRQNGTSSYWLLVVVMGGLWLGSIVAYGAGVAKIGVLGPVVGWPVFMSGAVIASAAWGTLFGEWKNSGMTAKAAMTFGVFCLIVAIVILGKAGS